MQEIVDFISLILKREPTEIDLILKKMDVIIKKDLIATNCHVTNNYVALSEKYESNIFIKEINKKNYALVEIYKEKQENDICIVKKIKDVEFSFPMKPPAGPHTHQSAGAHGHIGGREFDLASHGRTRFWRLETVRHQ